MDFVPPYPDRPTTRLRLPALLRRLRQNLVGVWLAPHFAAPLIPTRVLGRSVLVCNSPASVAAFLREADALERKTAQMRAGLRPLVGAGLIVADGPAYRARRRRAAPVTQPARLPMLAPAMTAAAAARAEAWERAAGEARDVLVEMGTLTVEVIARALFGTTPAPADSAEVVAAFAAYQRAAVPGGLAALLGLPVPGGAARRRAASRIHAVLDRMLAAASDAPALRAFDGAGLSPRALRDEAATLLLAGHETTATTLAWAWYLLDADRAAGTRVAAEARAALEGRAATLDDLPRLPFARAVLEETLRLYPPIPLLARQAARAVTIEGHRVPRGGTVMIVPWLLHRNPTLWEAPDAFRPERFLPPAPRPPRGSYLPFSAGPRACTGAAFALAEMAIVLATLAQRTAPVLVPGTEVMPVCRLTLRPAERLPMRLDPRP